MQRIIIILITVICITACTGTGKSEKKINMENVKETLVCLETTMGNITVKLYDETPKHKENFIKLVKEGRQSSTRTSSTRKELLLLHVKAMK